MDTPDYYSGKEPRAVSDERIRRELWSGGIPIEFTLSISDLKKSEDGATVAKPDPYYLHASRLTYLPLIADKAIAYFMKSTTVTSTTDVWLEYKDKPLQWHYPVGALFDLLSSQHSLPWPITVHFSNFPSTGTLRWPVEEDAIQSMFTHALKEAQYLKYFSTKSVMSLSKADQTQLWDGIRDFNYDLFWQVNHQLASYTTEQKVRCIPIRILTPGQPCIQPRISPYDEDGNPRLLGDVMKALFPDIFSDVDVTSGEDGGDMFQSGTQYPRVYVQGIVPRLDTPLTWLSQITMNPDNFLYLCLQTAPRS